MALTVQFNPQPFGVVTVTTPGTPVQLASNLTGFSPPVVDSLTTHIPCNKIFLATNPLSQAGNGNSGKVYIGQQGMNKTTLAGVVVVLSPGQSFQVTTNVNLNIYQFDQWYVDADTANDGVYGAFDVV